MSKNDIDYDKYWALRAGSVEWVYVITTLTDMFLEKVPAGHIAVLVDPQSGLYLLEKRYFPEDALARALGFNTDELQQRGIIELKVTPRDDLPEPTVAYWGRA